MEWSSVLTLLIGLFAGSLLKEFSDWMRSKREWNSRLNELKVENYAEWAAGMDANLVRYARQTIDSQTSYRTPLCEKRLLLIERDPQARRLIREVHESIPQYDTDDYHDLSGIAHSDPEWDWEPYRQKMDALLAHVRQKLM